MTDTQEYELQAGIDRVVRSGLVLEAGETIEAYPDILDDHDDVLQPVEGTDEADGDDTDEEDPDE